MVNVDNVDAWESESNSAPYDIIRYAQCMPIKIIARINCKELCATMPYGA